MSATAKTPNAPATTHIASQTREQFEMGTGIYLLSHSIGRPLKNTLHTWQESFLQAWQTGNGATWPRWLEEIDAFRNTLGNLLSVSASSVCPQVNLSSALSSVLGSLPANPAKNTLLYSSQDFPSMGYVLQRAERWGYRARCIPDGVDLSDPAAWSEQLNDDVALVLVTHVHSNTGLRPPVNAITRLARSREIYSVVDVAQSVGVIPIDLGKWEVDFVVGSCVKWLCGGPGAGFLWVSPPLIDQCHPVDVGWFSHEDPFEFDIHAFRYAADARRFWGGTPSVQPYVTAANSIRALLRIGIDTVREHNLRLSNLIIDAAGADAVASPIDDNLRGGTVVLKFPGTRQGRFTDALSERQIHFDERPTGVRLSPHIYTSVEEIDALIGAIETVA